MVDTDAILSLRGETRDATLSAAQSGKGIVPDFKFVGFRITSSLHLQLHLLSRKSAGDKVIITNKTRPQMRCTIKSPDTPYRND